MSNEVIDLCDTDEEETSFKRTYSASNSDLEEVAAPPKKPKEIVVLDSETGSSPSSEFEHNETTVRLKYVAHVRDKPTSGVFEQKTTDNFEAFFRVFSTDLDDLTVEVDGYKVPWYGTPEMAFDDGPVDELEVDVRSKSQPLLEREDEDDTPPEVEETLISVKINSPRGRCDVNVKPSHTIAKIAAYIGDKYGVDPKIMRVEFDGDSVKLEDTIEGLDIEDEDLIDFIWK